MKRYLALLLIFILACTLVVNRFVNTGLQAKTNPPKVFVSIIPQKYFVERIAGDKAQVSVMVGPGQSPATYEPVPQQMAALSEAILYFRIGVPFETAWMDKIRSANSKMTVIDTREGITLQEMATGHHDHSHSGIKDPHIWLSPDLVKIQAGNICKALIAKDPANKSFYQKNLKKFQADLEQVSRDIAASFKKLSTRKIMVFHPAWGYFARQFGLTQIPIEIEGKEPSAGELAAIIETAKKENIRVIFVQSQFSTDTAKTVASAIRGKVVAIDPLAEDYLNNLRRIAAVLLKEL